MHSGPLVVSGRVDGRLQRWTIDVENIGRREHQICAAQACAILAPFVHLFINTEQVIVVLLQEFFEDSEWHVSRVGLAKPGLHLDEVDALTTQKAGGSA